MATVGEKIESRRIGNDPENPSAELVYWAITELGEGDAVSSVSAVAPQTYGILVRQGEPDVAQVAPHVYDVTVRFGPRKPREPGDSSFSFDVSTGTQRITQSLETLNWYTAPGRDPVDYSGAIGVSQDGTVEGAEILVPEFAYTEEHTIENLSAEYIGTLFRTTGKINNAQFKHFAAYECLFVGASGRRTSEEAWRVTYHFLGSPKLTNIPVGEIENITKEGWDYLWVKYEDKIVAGALVQQPVQVFIEQVYYAADFSGLGIGT